MEYFEICRHISAYIVIYRHMSTYIGICRHISAYVVIYRHMSLYIDICLYKKEYIGIYRHIILCFPFFPITCVGKYFTLQSREKIQQLSD